MDFFHQQSLAARRLRLLRLLFLLLVAGTGLLLGIIAYLLYPLLTLQGLPWSEALRQVSRDQLCVTIVVTASLLMVIAYLRKLDRLHDVHQVLSTELAAEAADIIDDDPLLRRVCNIVEEMAIAAGIAAPRVYVLSHEHGINALAFGANPQQGSLAVTRGAVDLLQRDELQALIGHEISHLLRGDTVLNTSLIAASYSLMQLSQSGRHLRAATALGAKLGPIAKTPVSALIALLGLLTGVILQLLGSAGALGAHILQILIARSQERYADAAAIQFTRNPDAFARLLKLIAASPHGTFLVQNSAAFAHMLFAPGHAAYWLAVHPPLAQRIALVDPRFEAAELVTLRQQLLSRRRQLAEQRRSSNLDSSTRSEAGGQQAMASLNPDLAAAAALLSALPPRFKERCSEPDWVKEILCATLVTEAGESREQQLLLIAKQLGSEAESRVRLLLHHWPARDDAQRLAAWELSASTFRNLAVGERIAMTQLADRLVRCPAKPYPFDVALARLLRQVPGRTHRSLPRTALNGKAIDSEKAAISELLNILAQLGHPCTDTAQQALVAGLHYLWPDAGAKLLPLPSDWPSDLDRLLNRMTVLNLPAKQALLDAMIRCVTVSGINPAEWQWLRVIAHSLGLAAPLTTLSKAQPPIVQNTAPNPS